MKTIETIESIYERDHEEALRAATERYEEGFGAGEGYEWDGEIRFCVLRDSRIQDFRVYTMDDGSEVGVVVDGSDGDWAVTITPAPKED